MKRIHIFTAILVLAISGTVALADVIEDMVADVDPDLYSSYIQTLQDFGTRYTYTEQVNDAADYIHDTMQSWGLDTSYHSYYIDGYTRYNVIGEIQGTTYPDEIVIICGHYDSTSEDPWNNAPGADDNASGTSAAMEAARIMSQSQYEFERTVRFIGFSGEEQGLYGSYYYANDHRYDNIVAVLNFDMIGYVDQAPEDLDIIYPYSSQRWLAETMGDASDQYVPSLHYTYIRDYGGYSDHYYFIYFDFAALCLIEDMWPNNPYYHTSGDRLETLDIPFASDVVRAGVATLGVLAGASSTTVQVAAPIGWINLGWNWISFPIDPVDPDPATIFGGSEYVENLLYGWDEVNKSFLLYPDDFTEVEVAEGYTLWSNGNQTPSYTGYPRSEDQEIYLPKMGWAWIGDPFNDVVALADVSVRNENNGQVRTAQEDYDHPDPWVNWNLLYWDSATDSTMIATPEGEDDDSLRPWYGYRFYTYVDDLTLLVPAP